MKGFGLPGWKYHERREDAFYPRPETMSTRGRAAARRRRPGSEREDPPPLLDVRRQGLSHALDVDAELAELFRDPVAVGAGDTRFPDDPGHFPFFELGLERGVLAQEVVRGAPDDGSDL